MVKFKLGFTINAETLFHLMSKMLPIEDLSVEEVIERASAPARLDRPAATVQPKLKPKRHRDKTLDLKRGINGIIVAQMNDGMEHRAAELRKPVKAAGYSEASVSSRLDALNRHGVVTHLGGGGWKLTDRYSRMGMTATPVHEQ